VLHDLVVALLVFGTAGIVCSAGALAYARWRLRKQLRVRPSTRSAAPTSWLVSTSEPARLHRRLRKATATARLAGARGGATVAGLAAEIEDHAVAVEAQLVMLARVWRRERDARKQLAGQVTQLEQLAVRISASAVDATRSRALGPGSPDALAALTERIEALDAARAELAAIERTWNLS
jgi:hypothetical protein